jgi:Na+-transporting methylmalonyl-CoA/oxaloacetate decarboxylase beta subunit
MISSDTLGLLLQGLSHVTVASAVMIGLSLVLLYLGIEKGYEPLLLRARSAPGAMLANLPLSPLIAEARHAAGVLYDMGIQQRDCSRCSSSSASARSPTSGRCWRTRSLVLLGAAGQFGIFLTLLAGAGARLQRDNRGGIDRHHRRHRRADFDLRERSSSRPQLLGAHHGGRVQRTCRLVPIILPPIMRLTDHAKRNALIRMPYTPAGRSQPAHAHPVSDRGDAGGRHRSCPSRRR